MTVRKLAHDESIEVAGPILSLSNRLSDEDLLAIASGKSQDRLLAISKRSSLSEKVSDVLVTHGNRDVVISVTQNEGARFSDAGYAKLVDRSINDEVLAICVSMRKDIPQSISMLSSPRLPRSSSKSWLRAIRTRSTKCTGTDRRHRTDPATQPKTSAITAKRPRSSISYDAQARLLTRSSSSSPRKGNSRNGCGPLRALSGLRQGSSKA